jgi:Tol biopolymer transport system component
VIDWKRGQRAEAIVGATVCLTLVTCARFGFEDIGVGVDTSRPPGGGYGGGAGYGSDVSDRDAAVDQNAGGATASPSPSGGGSPTDMGGPDAAGSPSDASTPSPPSDGGSTADPGTPDASTPPAPCTTFGPFSTPQELALGQSQPFRPSLSADGSTLIYSAGNPGDLYFATRPDTSSLFSGGALLPGPINTGAAEVTPFLSRDGRSLFFATDRVGTSGLRDIMLATRASEADDFGAPSFVTAANSTGSDNLPTLSPDGRTLFFRSDRFGGLGAEDIWTVSRASSSGPFSNATNFAELNTFQSDSGVSLRGDGLEIFFASERVGTEGDDDLWVAERDTLDDAFGNLRNVSEVNGPAQDTDPALSFDGTELFFASSRTGLPTLWRSTRACLDDGP